MPEGANPTNFRNDDCAALFFFLSNMGISLLRYFARNDRVLTFYYMRWNIASIEIPSQKFM